MAVTGAQPQNMSRRAQGEVCGEGGWVGVESGGWGGWETLTVCPSWAGR